MSKKEKRVIAPEDRRDTTKDKQKIKKILVIILASFAVVGILFGILTLVTELMKPEYSDVSYNPMMFYEPDYDKNIYDDLAYMRLNRAIKYDRYGFMNQLTGDSQTELEYPSAEFFYDYFTCIIEGDYEAYPSYFTQECLNSEGFECPEKFTMQGVYDVLIKLHSVSTREVEGKEIAFEVFEVSYRIFENNGTFRRDILPEETRTLVFEIYVDGDTVLINSIAHRAEG